MLERHGARFFMHLVAVASRSRALVTDDAATASRSWSFVSAAAAACQKKPPPALSSVAAFRQPSSCSFASGTL